MLLEMVQLSLDGKYLAKGYSDLEYNLATVTWRWSLSTHSSEISVRFSITTFIGIFKNDMVHGSSEVTARSFARKLPSHQWRRKGWRCSTMFMVSPLDELVIHNRYNPAPCCLHCLLMFIIILTSSYKLM
jgi:hypothetical protein